MSETQAAPRTTTLDTVAVASGDPERDQPWADLGLKADEYARIREILGRRPTSSELAMYSVMWCEHCSYKSSKVHLKQFGDIPQETPIGKMLAGIGENAGVIDIGQGWAVTFKVESHNHPSYVEPYQGAATGIGGIVRDILAMGARPVAVMDPLRFGPLDAPDTHRVLPGIVAGVGGYGNCLGLPNIGGEAVFDATYLGNPLVNALGVGVLRHEDLHLAKASGAGNQVILYGARTGGDGIGGVSILASETFEDTGPAKRPSVQVGDPFMEKLLIECTLEIFAADLVDGIQDLGGAGLSCATSELASAGDGGMHVHLDRVPLRDSTLAPEEILMSESQERMMAVVEPAARRARSSRSAPSGTSRPSSSARSPTPGGSRSTGTASASSTYPPRRWPTTARPTTARSRARPGRTRCRPTAPRSCPGPSTGDELSGDPPPARRQPEPLRQVLDHRPVRPLRARQHRAVPARGQRHDPRRRLDQPRASRSPPTATVGSRSSTPTPARSSRSRRATATSPPVAPCRWRCRDCLNFGSPEDPDVMWQFAEACRGLKDACLEFGVPVTGGNVSLYNQTGETAILPTPVVATLGVIEDVTKRTPSGFQAEGEQVFLLGDTREELSGSEWAHVVHDHLGGLPPRVDLAAEQALARLLADASRDSVVTSAHDLSDGGLAQALAESSFRNGIGVSRLGGRRGGRRRVRRPLRRVRCPSHRDGDHRQRRPARRPGPAARRPAAPARPDRRRLDQRRGRVRDRRRRGEGRLERHAPRRAGLTTLRR